MLVVGRTPVWEMPEFVALNRLPMRVPLTSYPTAAAARAAGESPWRVSLDGTWRFRLVDSPLAAPEDFAALEHDDSTWGTIEVPGTWVRQGYDHPHYTNVVMPFRMRAADDARAQPDRSLPHDVSRAVGLARPPRRVARRLGRQRAARVRERRVRRLVERFALAGRVRSDAAFEARRRTCSPRW